MALEALRRIQAGREATAAQGTAVVADKVWIGTLTMTPNITFHRPVDERQSLAEFRRVKKGSPTRHSPLRSRCYV